MLRNIVTLVIHVLHASLQDLQIKHQWVNVVGAPLERVCLDIFDSLPKTRNGNKFILKVCDCFTKWIEAYPLKDQGTKTIRETSVNQFVCRFDTPMQIHSGQ